MPSVADTAVKSDDLSQREFCDVVGTITQSLSSVREVVKSLRDKQKNTTELDTKDGISLLSLKHHLILSYLQSLTLLAPHRVLGHAVDDRTPPAQSFGAADREARGSGAGDLVDSMVEGRVVLEKIKVLEGRMRYQIEKLVRVAEEGPSSHVIDDPLAFRPNPQNLMNNDAEESDEDDGPAQDRDGIYHPPRLAAVPYTEGKRDKKARRAPVPSALSALSHQDPSRPHIESTSGLGALPSLSSNRAREIHRMAEFEEENFTRLVMKKKDMKRRKKDEEDIALGGSGGISGRRRGGGFEDEFGDVLRSVGRSRASAGGVGDGYEELRMKGKKRPVLDRSRTRGPDAVEEAGEDGPRQRKRSRFEKEAKATRGRASQKPRR
ncbi:hypothetical protein FIBSPDRAFT_907218 [Athelia psychrophila]|uniref:Neuroguidin n=1 Tax=Athelia psychrophila TaxID=1759441 RepID=A0A166VAF6_9AGAM|nr:hypothetical protein FIBSPDRAFT_907218 [Fibularhizoctonia sp. CBS 109695]